MADITMPQLGETVTEGTITRWLKNVGDPVAEDEVLFEVSTDKVDSEVPSPASGFLSEILVQEGETVDVGARLAVISADQPSGNGGAAPAAAAPAPAAAPPPAAHPEPQAATDTQGEAAMQAEEPKQAGPPETELAPPPPAEAEDTPVAQPAAAAPAPSPAPAPAPAPAPSGGGGGDGSMSKVLSPVVRRLISEHNLDPDQIPGSGAGGRITRSDVLAVIEHGAAPTTTSAPAAAAE